jgi:excisionase family DNA binding protein
MSKSKILENNSTYPSVGSLAQELHMCERSVRDALRRGDIPHIRLGKRFVLPKAAIAEWLRNAGTAA